MADVYRISPLDLWTACLWLDMEAHRKLVLLSLCENADERGYCYPGRGNIAQRSSTSERRTTDHLAWLNTEGYAKVIKESKGPGQRTIRRVNIQRIYTEGKARQETFQSRRLAVSHDDWDTEEVAEEGLQGVLGVIQDDSSPITQTSPEYETFPTGKGDTLNTNTGHLTSEEPVSRTSQVEPAHTTGQSRAREPDVGEPSLFGFRQALDATVLGLTVRKLTAREPVADGDVVVLDVPDVQLARQLSAGNIDGEGLRKAINAAAAAGGFSGFRVA